MTWILKHTRSDRPMVAEYLCPVHGRFALTVDRDANGDPPDEMPCPTLVRLMLLPGSVVEEPCCRTSPFVISKPGYAKVKAVEAVRGGYQKAERPTWTDTTNLGEGQDLDDWWDDRAKVWDRHREDEVHKMAKEI